MTGLRKRILASIDLVWYHCLLIVDAVDTLIQDTNATESTVQIRKMWGLVGENTDSNYTLDLYQVSALLNRQKTEVLKLQIPCEYHALEYPTPLWKLIPERFDNFLKIESMKFPGIQTQTNLSSQFLSFCGDAASQEEIRQALLAVDQERLAEPDEAVLSFTEGIDSGVCPSSGLVLYKQRRERNQQRLRETRAAICAVHKAFPKEEIFDCDSRRLLKFVEMGIKVAAEASREFTWFEVISEMNRLEGSKPILPSQ